MRLLTFRTGDGGTRAGRVEGDEVVELDAADVGSLLAADPALRGADGPRHPLEGLDLAPLVPRPAAIFCLGLNYASHIEEMGRQRPDHPTLFAKFPRALIGARDAIELPPAERSTSADWEVELCVVIGRAVRGATPDTALDAVAGYAVANDVSIRDWQRRTSQFLAGKTWERTCPVGPWMVTVDELGDASDLRLTCDVDGERMQDGRTGQMLWDVREAVSYVSTIQTLEPGDLILTGTPDGVGAGRTPPVFLRPGQVLTSEIEGVGRLRNPCV